MPSFSHSRAVTHPAPKGGPWKIAALVGLVLGCSSHRSSVGDANQIDQAIPAAIRCRAPDAPPAFRLVDLFPGVRFEAPLAAARAGADWLVAGQMGKVVRVSSEGGVFSARPFLDVSGLLAEAEGESGLIGFTASPDYVTKPEVFVTYTGRSLAPGSVFRTVLSRMTSRDGGATIDPTTEEILLTVERDMKGHNGGRLVFGPDRMLYVGLGDGSWGDPLGRAQDTTQLFGKVLRLDVLGPTRPYASPPDNPFASGGGRPEVWAYGVRNPWSFSFDREGRMWLGDVGHEKYEEIDIVGRGANLQWPHREGRHCFRESPCDVPGGTDPVWEYSHVEGFAVTGGYAYRGPQPALAGRYVFADFMTGRLWSLDAADPTASEAQPLLDTGRYISGFAEDENGEILVIDFGGQILRIDGAGTASTEPASLASLDCLDESQFIPYDVNAPLWSDGLGKRRFLGLPGQRIHVQDDESFDFPTGAVVLKEFASGNRKIETRMMVKTELDGWLGYTFEWNDEQTDAFLRPDDPRTVDVEGGSWTIPSRGQCFACHRRSAGSLLGVQPAQLARDGQLEELARLGWLDRPVDTTKIVPMVNPYDEALPVEQRARSYLAANCAQCHSGAGSTAIDFRMTATKAEMNAVCHAALVGIDIPDAPTPYVILPSDPEHSVVVERMSRGGEESGLMPPLGRSQVDTAAVDVVTRWIREMNGCF